MGIGVAGMSLLVDIHSRVEERKVTDVGSWEGQTEVTKSRQSKMLVDKCDGYVSSISGYLSAVIELSGRRRLLKAFDF